MQPDLSQWPNKAQAAEAIGVSTKTVEKLSDGGLLQKQTWRRPGKPAIAVYHPDDVDRERKKRQPNAEPFVLPEEQPEESTAIATKSANPEALAILQQLMRPPEGVRPTERLYLTLKEASDLSGLSVSYLTRKIKAKELPAIKDVSWKVRRTELEKL